MRNCGENYREEIIISPTTITLLFLVFATVMFILEKIPLGLTATIVAIGDEARGAMTLPLDERGLTWDIAALTLALEERCPGLPEWGDLGRPKPL